MRKLRTLSRKKLKELAEPLIDLPQQLRNVVEASDDSPLWDRIDLRDIAKILDAARRRPGKPRDAKTNPTIEKIAQLKLRGIPYVTLVRGNEIRYAELRRFVKRYRKEIDARVAQLNNK